ncbi:MAG: hypothetical protein ACK54K_17920, partial [Gemmatimonadaceae bacterium]
MTLLQPPGEAVAATVWWQLLLPLPIVAASLVLAWRASRDLAFDRRTRRFWRLLMVAIALLHAEQLPTRLVPQVPSVGPWGPLLVSLA